MQKHITQNGKANPEKKPSGAVQKKVNYQYEDGPPPPEVMEAEDARAAAKDAAEAPDITDYSNTTPEMGPFPLKHVFPETVYEFITRTAEAMQVDPVMLALPAMSAMAAAIGTSRTLRLHDDGWIEYACLWTVILAHSGSNKSAPHERAVRPIVEADRKLIEEYQDQLAEWERERDEAEKNKAPLPKPPNPNRLCVKNVTIEQISSILSKNPKGLLLQRNELSGWLESFTKYSKGSAEDEWLDFYNGVGGTIDRKTKNDEGKNTISLKRPLVSVSGTSQPAVLEKLLGSQTWASGLAPRLIIASPPRIWAPYRHPPAGSSHYEDYRFCIDMVLNNLRGTTNELTLSPEADGLFVSDMRGRMKREEICPEGSFRASQLAKIRSIPARWALIHFVFSQVMKGQQTIDCQISEESMKAGCLLGAWVEIESARVMGILAKAPGESLENMWLKTLVGAGYDGMDANTFQRHHRSKKRPDYLENIEQAKAVLAGLVAARKVERFNWKPTTGPVQPRYRVPGCIS